MSKEVLTRVEKNKNSQLFYLFRSMEKLGVIAFCAARSACKADGVAFPYDGPEEIVDSIDLSIVPDILNIESQPASGESEKN